MLSASFLNDVISKKTLRIFIKIVYDLSNWMHHYYYILSIKTPQSKYSLSCIPLYCKFFVNNILRSQSGNSFYLIWFDCFVSLLWKLKSYSLKKNHYTIYFAFGYFIVWSYQHFCKKEPTTITTDWWGKFIII